MNRPQIIQPLSRQITGVDFGRFRQISLEHRNQSDAHIVTSMNTFSELNESEANIFLKRLIKDGHIFLAKKIIETYPDKVDYKESYFASVKSDYLNLANFIIDQYYSINGAKPNDITEFLSMSMHNLSVKLLTHIQLELHPSSIVSYTVRFERILHASIKVYRFFQNHPTKLIRRMFYRAITNQYRNYFYKPLLTTILPNMLSVNYQDTESYMELSYYLMRIDRDFIDYKDLFDLVVKSEDMQVYNTLIEVLVQRNNYAYFIHEYIDDNNQRKIEILLKHISLNLKNKLFFDFKRYFMRDNQDIKIDRGYTYWYFYDIIRKNIMRESGMYPDANELYLEGSGPKPTRKQRPIEIFNADDILIDVDERDNDYQEAYDEFMNTKPEDDDETVF